VGVGVVREKRGMLVGPVSGPIVTELCLSGCGYPLHAFFALKTRPTSLGLKVREERALCSNCLQLLKPTVFVLQVIAAGHRR
jgi:hypothetical protein